MMRKPAAVSLMVLSIALIGATIRLSLPYARNDLPQTVLSFLGPFAALIASIILLLHSPTKPKWIVTKWGLFAGGFLFVILQAFVMGVHWQEILDDGVAYWIFVNLPSLFLGIPFCLAGALLGWIADAIKNRRSTSGWSLPPYGGGSPAPFAGK